MSFSLSLFLAPFSFFSYSVVFLPVALEKDKPGEFSALSANLTAFRTLASSFGLAAERPHLLTLPAPLAEADGFVHRC